MHGCSVRQDRRRGSQAVVGLEDVFEVFDPDTVAEDRDHLGQMTVEYGRFEPSVPVVFGADAHTAREAVGHHLPVLRVGEVQQIHRRVVHPRREILFAGAVEHVPQRREHGDLTGAPVTFVFGLRLQVGVERDMARPRQARGANVDVGQRQAEVLPRGTAEERGVPFVPGQLGILVALGEPVRAAGAVRVGKVEHREVGVLVKDHGIVVGSGVPHIDARRRSGRSELPSGRLPDNAQRVL